MLRKIIEIDESKCDGCALCIPECKEGAIQIIEGKARLVSDLFCDGLGACIGYCPQGAITVIEREAQPYSERLVMEKLVNMPVSVIAAHLNHLAEHNEMQLYKEATDYLKEINYPKLFELLPQYQSPKHSGGGCPGSRMVIMEKKEAPEELSSKTKTASALEQWPIQLHLVNPAAPYFRNSELLIMSTCGPVASAELHSKFLPGRSVVIACPKLDYTEPYTDKLAQIFKFGNTPKAVVVIMEVPCCKGLSKFALDAAKQSGNTEIEIEEIILTLDGEIKARNYLPVGKYA